MKLEVDNSKPTIFTLKRNVSGRNGGSSEYLFECNNARKQVQSLKLYESIIGDKYMGVYDSLNCDEFVIYFDKPVFLESEKTLFTDGEIYEIGPFFMPYFKFRYKVGHKIYTRYQQLSLDYKKNTVEINKGDVYSVEYLVDNPGRSIMYLKYTK